MHRMMLENYELGLPDDAGSTEPARPIIMDEAQQPDGRECTSIACISGQTNLTSPDAVPIPWLPPPRNNLRANIYRKVGHGFNQDNRHADALECYQNAARLCRQDNSSSTETRQELLAYLSIEICAEYTRLGRSEEAEQSFGDMQKAIAQCADAQVRMKATQYADVWRQWILSHPTS